ncbi:hypothetical protein HDU87_005504 [Geranomyces variabilis]|uniref:Uncharacterized protein n=1 Tax=Geranomyces variabilis TaxID=109894 RepID=A0AAD5XLQ9_9FUNG|nr:hypothetical protein HDU87_005504 [Geranomyces variabilis]
MAHIVQLFEKEGKTPLIRGAGPILNIILEDSPFSAEHYDLEARLLFTKSPELHGIRATYPAVLDFLVGNGFKLLTTHQRDFKDYKNATVYTFTNRCRI